MAPRKEDEVSAEDNGFQSDPSERVDNTPAKSRNLDASTANAYSMPPSVRAVLNMFRFPKTPTQQTAQQSRVEAQDDLEAGSSAGLMNKEAEEEKEEDLVTGPSPINESNRTASASTPAPISMNVSRRGRGRPKKTTPTEHTISSKQNMPPRTATSSGRNEEKSSINVNSERLVRRPVSTRKAKKPLASPKTTDSTERKLRSYKGDTMQNEEDLDNESITDILMNPSPTKPASPFKEPTRMRSSGTGPPDGDRRRQDEVGTQHNGDSSRKNQSTRANRGGLVEELQKIDQMIDEARKIGYTKRGGGGLVLVEKVNSLSAEISQHVKERLKKLDAAYRQLQDASEDTESCAQENVNYAIDRVQKSIRQVKEALSDKNKKQTKDILTDIYFILIPTFLNVIKLAIQVRSSQGSLTTEDLNEAIKILDLLYQLSLASLCVPASMQPIADRSNKTYQLKRPIMSIVSILRELKRGLLINIKKMQDAAKLEERLNIEEQQKAQVREERQEAMEIERREKQRRREAMRKLLQRHERTLARRENRRSKKRKLETSAGGHEAAHTEGDLDERHHWEDDEDDPFAERVKMFPSGNKRGSVRQFSKTEMEIIFGILAHEDWGHRRYEEAAVAVNADITDIHDFAKWAQRVMDEAHENLEMVKAADHWTFNIWSVTEGRN